MKKTVIRFLSVLLTFIFVVSVVAMNVNAEEIKAYSYQVYEDGSISLTNYHGDEKNVVIPEVYEGHTVVKVWKDCFNNFDRYAIESISIPKTVKLLNADGDEAIIFSGPKNLKNIFVSEENEYYSSINGILTNKLQNKIISYPKNYQVESYEVPSTITSLGYSSIILVSTLKEISFEGKEIISIDEDNLSYLPNLIKAEYPNSSAEYAIFTNCPNLTTVIIPEYVKIMNDNDFSESPNVVLYVYKDSYGYQWAKDHGFEYVVIEDTLTEKDLVDAKTGIEVTGLMDSNAVLKVDSVDNTIQNAIKTFNINLENNGNIIQPSGEITVSIPCEYDSCDILYIKDDGTQEKIESVYEDGYYKFTVSELGTFVITSKNIVPKYSLGDVDGDGIITIKDATCIQLYLAKLGDLTEDGKAAADYDRDGIITIKDATYIQLYLAKLL